MPREAVASSRFRSGSSERGARLTVPDPCSKVGRSGRMAATRPMPLLIVLAAACSLERGAEASRALMSDSESVL